MGFKAVAGINLKTNIYYFYPKCQIVSYGKFTISSSIVGAICFISPQSVFNLLGSVCALLS